MKYIYFLLIILLATACSNTTSSNNSCEDDKACNKSQGLQCSDNIIYSCDYDKQGCLVKTPFEDCSAIGKKCETGAIECTDKVDCSDDCNMIGASCKDTNTIMFCGQFDDDACNEYSEETIKCGQAEECKNGECVLKQSFCETNSDCGGDATCESSDEGPSICTCSDGYTYNSVTKTCDDINECEIDNGGCEQICANNDGGFACSCGDGYSLTGDNKTCSDINECEQEIDDCDINATCKNLEGNEGKFECICNEGWAGDGVTCTDIDDCESNPCVHATACADTGVNSYTCTCESGWQGINCDEDINDCAPNPCVHATSCTDTGTNSYSCACESGWQGTNCDEDINDCVPNPCVYATICTDTGNNSYSCTCESGWQGTNCDEDVNDCAPNPCAHGTCTDTGINSYTCACEGGWQGINCDEDINECANAGLNNCHDDAYCTNTPGSFNCTCKDGYEGNGITSCLDIDECTNNDDNNCNANATCYNTPGSFTCACNDGYHGGADDGIECLEVCGDGINTESEECDDGNNDSGDGCSDTCIVEYCGDGIVNNNGEQCDDGDESANCNDDCTPAVCGDNKINTSAGEECDDGGETANCNVNCSISICGDGILNKSADEVCDDGNTSWGDGCNATCNVETGWNCDESSPTVCEDIDECAEGLDNCNSTQYCINREGSYDCTACGCEVNNTVEHSNSCEDETGQCDCLPMYEGTTCSTVRKLKIYVTNNIYQGNLGGVSGADNKCNNDANKPSDGHYYKALLGADKFVIGSGTVTIRGLDEDWVLEKNMNYYRAISEGPNNTYKFINTTDSNKAFDFDFDNSIIIADKRAWTGLDEGFNNYVSTKTCDKWNSSDHDSKGKVGKTNDRNSNSIQKEDKRCDEFRNLYCVEQVCPEGEVYNIDNASDEYHGECVSE